MTGKQYIIPLLVALLLTCTASVQGQELSNWRVRTMAVTDTLVLDTMSLVPGSFVMEDGNDNIIPMSAYRLDEAKGILTWSRKSTLDSVVVRFKVFPVNFAQTRFKKDARVIERSIAETANPFVYNPFSAESSGPGFGGLNYSGGFSRGISFGNNQDLVPTSDLNLQLSGKLNDVQIVAAITDQNIPIQPEGNTQQLQEFDRIFIQLKWKRSELIMGDYELRRPKSYFMNFYKRTQGGNFINRSPLKNGGKLTSTGSVAFSKGEYYRYIFNGEEGNQGPYKLRGRNGELFIIILGGTERVFIDGEELKRGADKDYVINYNTAELTFTPNRLITKDKRIQIEYEYSNQNYSRFLSHAGTTYEKDKLKLRFNYYLQQDNKNRPVQEFSDEQNALVRETLANAGDSLSTAFISGIGTTEFDVNRVLYKMVDSTVIDSLAGDTTVYDSVFVFSTNEDSAIFALNFTYLGTGRGNYEITQSVANGRVYRWVPPINGVPQGSYEPVIKVVAPARRQMMTLAMDYAFSKDHTLTTEVAFSENDINTFSKRHSQDNIGFAGMVDYDRKMILGKDSTKKESFFKTAVTYEHRNKFFAPIERYRPVEFNRNWNIEPTPAKVDENIGNVSLALGKKELGLVGYDLTAFFKDSIYQGLMHGVTTEFQQGNFFYEGGGTLLTTTSLQRKTTFIRPKIDMVKHFPKLRGWKLGVYAEREENRVRNIGQGDTLSLISFKYDEYRAYTGTADTSTNKLRAEYKVRYDYFASGTKFDTSSIGRSIELKGGLNKNPRNKLRWTVAYRELEVIDTAYFINLVDEQSLLARVEYAFSLKKGVLRSTTLYEVGTGQEQKLEFTFLKVAAGEGQYSWNVNENDYNNNGIPDEDEFVEAAFQDKANYIKVFTPTNEFIKAHSVVFNQNLHLDPRSIWSTKSGLRKGLSHFATQSSLQIARKSFDDGSDFPFNPFIFDSTQLNLVSLNTVIRNTLYFNRTSTKFGANVGMQSANRQSLLVNGFERRTRDEISTGFRWNITKKLALESEGKMRTEGNDSEFFNDRDYNIESLEVEPKLTLLAQRSFRVTGRYLYRESINSLGPESAFVKEIGLEARYTILSKSTLNLQGSFVSIYYPTTGGSNQVQFIILEGLQPGDNMLWTVTYERRLGKNVQMSLNYEGRNSERNPTVHVGRAQVRALF